jgi:hypothetical protein
MKTIAKQLTAIALTCGALMLVSASAAFAETSTLITFGETDIDIGNHGPIVENGYQYNAMGASWSLQNGGPPADLDYFPSGSALVTFWGIEPVVGNVVDFSRLDGRPFLFQSLQLRGRIDGARNDVVLARGFFGGAEVANQLFQSSSELWRTDEANSSFATAIDELRLEVVEYNFSTLIFDNLTFEVVPEPSGCVLVAFVASAFLMLRHRRTL